MNTQASEQTPNAPTILGSSAWIGAIKLGGDSYYWDAARRLYDEDKLKGAHELATQLGDGEWARYLPTVRLIESEYDLNVRGEIFEASEFLTIQYLPDELSPIEPLAELALRTEEAERRRFGWTGQEKVRLALLSQEMDNWWATARYGYCVQKVPFYKICLPHHALRDARSFHLVFAHEFAHVISLSSTKKRLSDWLGEGFSVYASNDLAERARDIFRAQPKLWLDPIALERRFSPAVELDSSAKWLAYQQGGWLTLFLAHLKGDQTLSELFHQHTDESFWRNVKISFNATSKTADAIQHTFGITETQLFEDAYKQVILGQK